MSDSLVQLIFGGVLIAIGLVMYIVTRPTIWEWWYDEGLKNTPLRRAIIMRQSDELNARRKAFDRRFSIVFGLIVGGLGMLVVGSTISGLLAVR